CRGGGVGGGKPPQRCPARVAPRSQPATPTTGAAALTVMPVRSTITGRSAISASSRSTNGAAKGSGSAPGARQVPPALEPTPPLSWHPGRRVTRGVVAGPERPSSGLAQHHAHHATFLPTTATREQHTQTSDRGCAGRHGSGGRGGSGTTAG